MKFIFFLVLFYSSFAHAATSDNLLWLSLTAQGQFSESTSFGSYSEFQTRASEDSDEFYENVFRLALFYKTESSGDFFIGTLSRYDSDWIHRENRPWVQWSKALQYESWPINIRLRHELRDLKGVDEDVHRSRVLLRFSHKDLEFKSIQPFFSSELFYNWNTVNTAQQKGISQGRYLVGAQKNILKSTQLQAGYMQVHVYNPKTADQINHVLNLTLNYRY